MSDNRARSDADHCFVCGTQNPIGLGIVFFMDAGVCRGEFCPSENHVGFDGITHGGIIFSVLDDLMANWLFLQKGRGFTAKCEIRYREPLLVGTKISVECQLRRRKGRLLQLVSKALREDGLVVAEADASFMITEIGEIPS
ncbi:MAG: PaaI family thioesterase [Proteobacteria bacterium]|nr:PaaI family thioesterase [Pseudomonadota bacterium]